MRAGSGRAVQKEGSTGEGVRSGSGRAVQEEGSTGTAKRGSKQMNGRGQLFGKAVGREEFIDYCYCTYRGQYCRGSSK